jgi:hypothetical protein
VWASLAAASILTISRWTCVVPSEPYRLPFDPDKLATILSDIEPDAAENPSDQDYSSFWLVLADQFSERGLDSRNVHDKALEIIDSGRDVAMKAKLGMKPNDLAKRTKVLNELRDRLINPTISKPRKTMKQPQPYIMDAGDALVYPTWSGHSINPYIARNKQRDSRPNDGGARS